MDPPLPLPSTSSHSCGPSPARSKRRSLFAPEDAPKIAPIPASERQKVSMQVRDTVHKTQVISALQKKNAKLRMECAALAETADRLRSSANRWRSTANQWRSTANVFNTVLVDCPACTLRMKTWHKSLQHATFVKPPTRSFWDSMPPLVPLDPRLNNTEASGSMGPRSTSASTEVAVHLSPTSSTKP